MNHFITKYLAIMLIGSLSLIFSYSAEARYANQVTIYDQLRAPQPTQAVTVCFYRPKVLATGTVQASAKRSFTVQLNGHVSCSQEYNLGMLYYLKHTYK